MQEAAPAKRRRKRIGYMKRKERLGRYVRVDQHGCEGTRQDNL